MSNLHLQYAIAHQLEQAAQGLLGAAQSVAAIGASTEFRDRLQAIRGVAEMVARDVQQLKADIQQSEAYRQEHADAYLTTSDVVGNDSGFMGPMQPMSHGSIMAPMASMGPSQHSPKRPR